MSVKDKAKEIIESIRSGENSKALQYLYKDPLNKIRNFILTNSGSIDDANDVFQDAVITLFHYVKTGRYKEQYDLDGFLFRVAKNAWIDKVRKDSKVISGELKGFDMSGQDNQLDELISAEKLSTFHALFNKLEERCRDILRYVVFENKTMKEVAQLMQLKDDTVAKSQHYRCKKYFMKIIQENKEAISILRN